MNRNTVLVTALLGVFVGGVAGYLYARRDSNTLPPTPAGTSASAASPAPAERRVLYWHDPMVPGTRFDKPGKSPYMDMDLVPVYASAEEGGPEVRVPAATVQNLGIRTGTVEMTRVPQRFSAVGSVAFDESRLEVVQARVGGYVARLHVKAPLEHVQRGQPLADIVAPEWLAAEEEYLALLDAQSERARSIRDAARRRLIVLGVPEAAIRSIEAEHRTSDTVRLVAPIDGVVTELAVREGAAFMPGAALFRINGLESVWINAQVPEAQVSMVPVGAGVEARATGWPGETFSGRVTALLPDVDPATRTLSVRIEIENSKGRLAPGMFVSLDIAGQDDEPRLVVPSEAVISTGKRNVVVVARDDGGFDVTDVTVGSEADGKTTILQGLSEGQRIVLSGQFLIDSEANLKSTVTRLGPVADSQPTAEPTP